MKPFAAFFALGITSLVCRAQINFQPGYYIRNDGTTISCLIKDYGWLDNPTSIRCKSTPDAEPVPIGMDSILEFGVGGAKYRRYDVDVETSVPGTDELSHSAIPTFRHLTVLLKVLVEGRASLYVYTGKHLNHFFYRLNGTQPVPLVYKEYVDQDGGIHANQEYIRILADSLGCAAPDLPAPASVRYEARDLARFFIAYNTCAKSAYTDYYAKSVKPAFHLDIRPGVEYANLTITDNSSSEPVRVSYGSHTGFRLGAEAELTLPFNRNKWAALIEPAFRTFQSNGAPGYNIDYKALQVLVCGRYYLFLNADTRLYLTAGIFTDFNLGSTFEFESNNLVIEPRVGETMAAGFRYKDRFGIELQYQIPQQVLNYFDYVLGNQQTTSLVLSYRIL